MKKTITIFFSIVYLFSLAQKPTIKVLDIESKEALPYVNLCFESFDQSQKQYAVTNADGEVTNPCQTNCVVAISFVGYKTIVDTLASNTFKVYFLEADIFNLEQVVVTATRTEKALKDAPVITQVITAKEMSNRGITNVKDVLEEDIPGLEFQRGGFGSDIKMQGLEAKNILILVDGERLAGESGYNVDYSRLNTENVERIEIVKGAASALYGSQAMGGVINIITKKTRKKLEVSVGAKYSQNHSIDYPDLESSAYHYEDKQNLDLPNLDLNASIGFNLKGFSGRTDLSAKSFDAYQQFDKIGRTKAFTNIDTTVYDKSNPLPKDILGFKDYSIGQKFSIPLHKKLKLTLRGSYYNHDEYNFEFKNLYQNFQDYSYGGKLTYLISDKYSLVASFHQDTYDKYDVKEKLNKTERVYSNTYINPKLVSSLKLGKKQNVTIGAEYLSDQLYTELFSDKDVKEKQVVTSVIFLQDDINLTKKLNVIIGGRADIHEVFGMQFSPKVSAMYKQKAWTFRGNYAKGFRSPSLKELYLDWQVAWFTIKGDENLKPETNDYVSFSTEYTKDWLNTSVTLYKNWLVNKIDGVWNAAHDIYQYRNVNSADLSGVEFAAKIKMMKHFMLSGAYSFLHDQRPVGELVSQASPHTGNIKLAYHFTRKKYELNVNISANIIGAKDYIEKEAIMYRGVEVEGEYPVHFDAYSIWRFAVNQKFLNGINLTLGVDNIFDYTADVISFNTSTTPGRIAFVSLKMNLDKLINIKSK